jgi:hypothetical protein
VPEGISSDVETFYYGTSNGRIKVRKRSAFSQSELLYSALSPGELFTDIWTGVRRKSSVREIRHLALFEHYLIIQTEEEVSLFDLQRNSITAHFHREKESYNRLNICLYGNSLMISWGSKIYFCKIGHTDKSTANHTEPDTFTVGKVYDVQNEVVGLEILDNRLMILQRIKTTEGGSRSRRVSHSHLPLPSEERSHGHRSYKKYNRFFFGAFDIENVEDKDSFVLPQECCLKRSEFLGMTSGTGSNDPLSITGTDKPIRISSKRPTINTQIYMVFAHEIMIILPLKVSERVLWLV